MIVVHSVGPYLGIEVYWGIEYDPPAYISLVGPGWLVEDLPPYRRSRWGAHVRLGNRVLHFGTCIRSEDPHRRLGDITEVSISEWRGPSNGVQGQGTGEGADPGGEPLRPPVIGGSVPPVGVGAVNGDSAHRHVPGDDG